MAGASERTIRLYKGAMKALLRRYEGAMKAVLVFCFFQVGAVAGFSRENLVFFFSGLLVFFCSRWEPWQDSRWKTTRLRSLCCHRLRAQTSTGMNRALIEP
jgi:hypothetical protein